MYQRPHKSMPEHPSIVQPNKRPLAYMGYDDIALWIESIRDELMQEDFISVVGVLRGGAFPAQTVAFATALPLYFMHYDRTNQTPSWVGAAPPPGTILLCEDYAGSGVTLENCLRLVDRTHRHKLLTLVTDNYSWHTPHWTRHFGEHRVVLPWERHCQSSRYLEDWFSGGAGGKKRMGDDEDYRFYAMDLDGVLCEDIDSNEYQSNLEALLGRRDQLPLASNAPTLIPGRHVVVTGRPTCDAQRTRAWLDRNGMVGIDAHFREVESHSDAPEAVASHKGRAASELGCSDFMESCPHQAILLASLFPHLRVHWWRGGHPILVSASQVKP